MFKILFVCTGNRCRSPFAEASFRRFCSCNWVGVSSAGTLEFEDMKPPSEMVRVAQSFGVDLSGYRSRHLAASDASGADLVLGMSLEHVSVAAVEGTADPARSFTLLEFLRLASLAESRPATNESEARALVAEARRLRSGGRAFSPRDEIRDPIGGPESGYVEAAQAIDKACRDLAAHLCGGA
jgi:protein-tyrosine phosphatase